MKLTKQFMGTQIVAQAERFVGLYEQVNNSAWDDPLTPGEDKRASELKRIMEGVGWKEGWSYCCEGDTEVLTESGWVRMEGLNSEHGRVAQVGEDGSVTFAYPSRYIYKLYDGKVAHCKNRDVDIVVDAGHRFWGSWQRSALDMRPINEIKSELRIPPACIWRITPIGTDTKRQQQIEFAAAFIADGFTQNKHGKPGIAFGVSKTRKVEVLRSWNPVGMHKQSKIQKDSAQKALKTIFRFRIPEWFMEVFGPGYKELRWSWLLGLSCSELRIFLNACLFWSGGLRGNSAEIRTARKPHADIFSAAAALAGYQAKCYKRTNKFGFNPGGTLWHVRYSRTERRNRVLRRSCVTFKEEKQIPLFCVTVPEGRILIRDKGGNIYTTGNCSAFCEAIWTQAYRKIASDTFTLNEINLILCPHVMTSWRACLKKGRGSSTYSPLPGSIAFFKHGNTDSGHAAIVTAISELGGDDRPDVWFSTVEGNTMPEATNSAKDREGGGAGDGVFRRVRRMNYGESKGLVLQGFMQPMECDGHPLSIRALTTPHPS